MIISASNARAQLFPLIQQVNQDQAPVTITSNNGNAVLVSESEWESILETAFLLRTASNRSHLEKSIAALEHNKGVKRPHAKGKTLGQLLEITVAGSRPVVRAKKKVPTVKPVQRAKKIAATAKPSARKSTVR
ncbi:MAG: type II toxin-antitoxin system Phd/YefM family antitoxin [Candidatus Planktophila sp.]|nr:type II toxin-antitoxin system Phd/YefM family antitoxin [Candidatus Planktophila sp.]